MCINYPQGEAASAVEKERGGERRSGWCGRGWYIGTLPGEWPGLLESKEAGGGPFPFHCLSTAVLFLELMEVQKALKDRIHTGKRVQGWVGPGKRPEAAVL